VVLSRVDLSSSGLYKCEVSAEAPSFQTVSERGQMIVVGEYALCRHANSFGVNILTSVCCLNEHGECESVFISDFKICREKNVSCNLAQPT
jgi:hypothetical protein